MASSGLARGPRAARRAGSAGIAVSTVGLTPGVPALLVHGGRGGLDRFMGDTTITKVDSTHSPRGPLGQTYLATGVGVGMRLWRDRSPGEVKPQVARAYETVGG